MHLQVHQSPKFTSAVQFARIHTSSVIKIGKILDRPITKSYNSDDVNVIAAELRLTETRSTSFHRRHIFCKSQCQQMYIKFWKLNVKNRCACMAYCKLRSRIRIWNPAEVCSGAFLRKPVDCFHRGAASLVFDGFLNVTMCVRRFPPLGSHKGIINSLCLLILFTHTKHKNNKMKCCTEPMSSFPSRRFIHWVDKTENVWLIVGQLPEKKLGGEMFPLRSVILAEAIFTTTIRPKFSVPLIYFFYLHTTIRQKYMVLFHLILDTTIWPKIRVLIDLFLLYAHNHSTEIYGPFSFIFSLVHDHSTKT